MDGNGRWAKQKGKMRSQGHKQGIHTVRNITTWCAKNHISYLSLYAFSTENWNRPKNEIDFLMKLLKQYLQKERKTYLDNDIKFLAIGNIEAFSNPLKQMIQNLQEDTAKNSALTQILALNYGAKDEIARACKKIIQNDNHDKNINMNELIAANLDTKGIPDVDLLIRTGGEMRLSNFLLWQISYAELFFTPTLWPDFTPDELSNIIKDFKTRSRTFGSL
ncbi:di-trans,poly-cis-decaprenylcistransferase [Helicobacter sp. 13S00477-4]|nr:di-trans,poly-cis-decaprenylcistransferase [Helicobacter sp. 13S00477-4]